MADRIVRIVVGASVDPSVKNAFKPIEVAAQQARKAVAKDLDVAASARVKSDDKANSALVKSAQKLTAIKHAELIRQSKAVGKSFDEQLKASAKAASAQQRDIEKVSASNERASKKAITDAERADKKKQAIDQRNLARKARVAEAEVARGNHDAIAVRREFGGRLAGNVGAIGRAGLGVARGVAEGIGVDMSPTALIGKSTSMQKTVTDTVNSAASAHGRSGTIEEVKATEAAIKDAANSTSNDYNKMSEGLMNFVQRSSDLKTGTAILKDMGQLARATGTDVGEIMTGAGPIAKLFEGEADQAERVAEAMRLIAKQGAMGNVEMRELAPKMGVIASGVGRYADPKHGVSRDKILGQLGAIAQISMQGGGVGATDAARAAANFGRDLAKKQSTKAFGKIMGSKYSVFTDENHEHMKAPEQIMMDVLRKTHGNQSQISELFRNTSSAKGMLGVQNAYEKAGGGEAGLSHVEELLKSYSQTMEKSEVNKAAALSQGTDEAKAQKFNNAMQDAAESVTQKLVPELEKLVPSVIKLTTAFASMVGFAIENPIKAGALALGAAIAKAGVETVVSNGIKKALEGSSKGGMAISVGLATFMITAAVLDKMMNVQDSADDKSRGDANHLATSRANLVAGRFANQGDKDKAIAAAEAEVEATKTRIAAAEKNSSFASRVGSNIAAPYSAAANFLSAGSLGTSFGAQANQRADVKQMDIMRSELAKSVAVLNAIKNGTLQVNVVNMPPGGPAGAGGNAPTVDQGARTK